MMFFFMAISPVSLVGNMMAAVGVQLFNWTISLALANPFSPWRFIHAVSVAHHALRELLPMLMRAGLFAERRSRAHSRGLWRGAGACRVVTLSLRSRGARLNTSYSNTKGGCDVHTNEPIIGGFVTQFLLSLI